MPLLAAISWAHVLGVEALHAHIGQFSPADTSTFAREVREVHAAGLELLLWGLSPAEAGPCGRAGVDALCVDLIGEALRAIAEER
jgi:glycerophosphoryl diester phosphodiesterase